jgi:hypothetical protein
MLSLSSLAFSSSLTAGLRYTHPDQQEVIQTIASEIVRGQPKFGERTKKDQITDFFSFFFFDAGS